MALIPQMINAAFIGDRLVDTARSFGIYPKMMATALTPMIEKKFPCTRQIECTSCVMNDKRKVFTGATRKMGIDRIVLEKSGDPRLDPSTIAEELQEDGFTVDTVDFSKGISKGILNAGDILDCKSTAERVAARYKKQLEQALENLRRNSGKKALVLLGITRPGTQEDYLLVEDGGQVNDNILTPMGCTNVGAAVKESGAASDALGVRVIENLDGIIDASPDIIALTGDPSPALRAIYKAIADTPPVAEVPAIANHAIFSLPHCCEGEPLELPYALERWSEALSNI